MPKLFFKLLVSLLATVTLFFSIVPITLAQSAPTAPWYNQSFPQWSAKVFGGDQNEIFGERYTYAQVNWIINSLTAIVIGSDITQCIQAGSTGNLKAVGDCASKLAPPTTPQNSSSKSTGASGPITTLAYLTGSMLSFRPASGMEYLKKTATNLHVMPQAYAQTGTGAGYNTLSPVQSLWGVVRDISYALMVVVIIIMAFMIMFRAKISPQVVITVQSALPKIAIALVLITFSYAIAGFLVDFMYVILAAFAAMIKIGDKVISQESITYLFGQLNSLNGLVSLSVGIIIIAAIITVISGVLIGGSAIAAFSGIGLTVTPGGIAAAVIMLIFAIFLLFILFRLFWLMIRTAAVTVLLIIAGPIMILTETLGAGGGFTGWIRNLLANLSVYPTVAIMIFLSHYFFWGWAAGAITQIFPSGNPLNTYAITALNLNGTNGIINLPGMPIGTSVLGFALSFVILFLIPRTAHVIEATINRKPVDVAGAVSQGAGPITTAARFGAAAGIGKVVGDRLKPLSGSPTGDALSTVLNNFLKRISS